MDVIFTGLAHVVRESSSVTHPNGVTVTSWTAACGASGDTTARQPFRDRRDIYRKMWCTKCKELR